MVGEFPGRQRCYQKKPRGFYIAREAAKVGETPENVEAEGKMIFLDPIYSVDCWLVVDSVSLYIPLLILY